MRGVRPADRLLRSIGFSPAGVSNFMRGSSSARARRRAFARPAAACRRCPAVGRAPASSCSAAGCAPRGSADFGGFDAPRHVRDAAERDSPAAVALHHRCDRHQRERVRGAVAHLAIDVRAAERLGQRHRRDQFAGRRASSRCAASAGQPVEVGDRNATRVAVRPRRLDRRVEHAHRHRHVARMGGDAGLAAADHGVLAAVAADRRAAAARDALVARLVGVVEVGAARALQQVARGRRHVAQLAGGAGQQRAREHAVVAPDARIGGEIGVADQRADAQAAVRRRLDLVEAEAVDVDQVRRRLDLELHQIEQVGAAGDELRARRARAAAAASAGVRACS